MGKSLGNGKLGTPTKVLRRRGLTGTLLLRHSETKQHQMKPLSKKVLQTTTTLFLYKHIIVGIQRLCQ